MRGDDDPQATRTVDGAEERADRDAGDVDDSDAVVNDPAGDAIADPADLAGSPTTGPIVGSGADADPTFTIGSSFDTLLGLYTGAPRVIATVSNVAEVASDDEAGGGSLGASAITCQVTKDAFYLAAVDGFDGASGDLVLNGTFTPGTVPAAATGVSVVRSGTTATVSFTPGWWFGGDGVLRAVQLE